MFLGTTAAGATLKDLNATNNKAVDGRGRRKVTPFTMSKHSKNRHIDMSVMDDLLDETDKDTEIRRAWVAIRNNRGDGSVTSEEDSQDDNSVDYLSDAISGFFRRLCSCDCWKGRSPT